MSSSTETEIWKNLQETQKKIVFFLIGASGTCIGFALTQAKELSLDYNHLALAFALLSWGISAWCGLRWFHFLISFNQANLDRIKVQSGRDPDVGNSPQLVARALQLINEALENLNKRIVLFATWQQHLLLIGIASYVTWQILLMVQRTSMAS